jgi:DNA (cytosine-5)-methyltransferase 1
LPIRLEQTHTLNIKGNDSIKRIYSSDGLCQSLTTMQGGHREPKVAIEKEIIKLFDIPKEILNDNERQRRVYSPEGISPAVIARSDSAKILQNTNSKIAIANGVIEIENDEVRVREVATQTLDTACNQVVFSKVDSKYLLPKERLETCLNSNHSAQRVYCPSGIAPTISAGSNGGGKEPVKMVYGNDTVKGDSEIKRIREIPKTNYIFRKLTPRECFRLQGFDDSFIFPPKMSDTQLYKQAGNGMSRNVLDMIFTQIFKSKNFDLSSNS